MHTMNTVHLSSNDIVLLHCFPRLGSNLETLIWYYTSTNRSAPPSYLDLKNFLTKVLSIGVVRKEGQKFTLEAGWFERIHAADSSSSNEFESMERFEESIAREQLPLKLEIESDLTEQQYLELLVNLRRDRY